MRARKGFALAFLGTALSALAALGAGCGGGGGSGGGGSTSGASTANASGQLTTGQQAGGSALNGGQWQVAMAALAQAQTPDPVRLEPASLAAWNLLLERNWPHLIPMVEAAIGQGLQTALQGLSTGTIQVRNPRNLVLDAASPPQVRASAPGPRQAFELALPGGLARWSFGLTADVGGTIPLSIGGYSMPIPIFADLSIAVTDIRIRQAIDLDLSNPQALVLTGPHTPSIDFTLALSSSSPLLSQISASLTTILDPVIRVALVAGGFLAQSEVGALLGALPQGPAWGLGGPGIASVPVAQRVALEALADTVSETIQRDLLPYGHVFPAVYTSPTSTVVARYHDHGDSAIWTGHYLAGEAYRFDMTGDPRALAGAARATEGIHLLLEVAGAGGGLLSRAAIPLASPHAQGLGTSGVFVGHAFGQDYLAKEIISRDQYTGVMLGLGQTAYRIPALRDEAAPLIDRVLAYLEGSDWIAHRANHTDVSVTFATAPSAIMAFTRVGALTDPARWGPVNRGYDALGELLWFNSWFSSLEVHESYYKFNLGHANLVSLFELETDPALYRAYLKSLRVTRVAVGHHQNAWFDGVFGMAVPPQAPQIGALVEEELQHWALRPARGFSVQNSQNGAIPTAIYTISLPNTTGGPAGGFVTQTRSREVALFPLPIELRPPTDFLWQRDPFRLDGSRASTNQAPGIDLLLPYWFARSHGLF